MDTNTQSDTGAQGGLAALDAAVRRDLDIIRYPRKEWVPAMERDGQRVLDVAIIGAGQGGLATAFASSVTILPMCGSLTVHPGVVKVRG